MNQSRERKREVEREKKCYVGRNKMRIGQLEKEKLYEAFGVQVQRSKSCTKFGKAFTCQLYIDLCRETCLELYGPFNSCILKFFS